MLFVDLELPIDGHRSQQLANQGFRRSGRVFYRPHCNACRSCVPLRLPVADFRPNRSQRRCWRRNAQEIAARALPAGFSQEHFELYVRYTVRRHPGGGMADAGPADYLDFLFSPWAETMLVEFRLEKRLVAVAVTDRLPQGLSAVYTYFDPALRQRSLGMFAILWQIQQTRALGLSWLYLGYWIADCRKMAYKDLFRPLEAWTGRGWKRFGAGEPIRLQGGST
jgi:arginine-tRNA-protein transferase